jgi:hypothetical protein
MTENLAYVIVEELLIKIKGDSSRMRRGSVWIQC